MGKFLGAYDGEEIDRPDLNKCPDCGCFFAGDNCPLCGKICPEEFRAGNRKTQKKKKKRGNPSSRTVTFIDWYHSWTVIIIALIFFPLLGIILLLTSPHKKSLKISIAAVTVIWGIISNLGLGNIIGNITSIFDSPVDTSLTKEEYIAACEDISAEEFYRGGESYNDKFVSFAVTVSKKIVDTEMKKYPTHYVCYDESGNEFIIIIRDCSQDSSRNYISGDKLVVYGEGAGEKTLYDYTDTYEEYMAPCLNVAYINAE